MASKTILRILKTLLFIVLIQTIYGCTIYHSWSAEGYDPLARVNSYPFYFTSQPDKADSYCSMFNERLHDTKIKNFHKLQEWVDSTLRQVEVSYEILNQTALFSYYKIAFACDPYGHLNELCPKISISIFSIGKPLALSYPKGEIHISRSFLDGDLLFCVKNQQQLTALITHEFIHIRHGHVRYHWAVADAINRFNNERRKKNWSKLLRILPISYSRIVYSPRDLSQVYLLDDIFEYLADFYTAIILSHMGYDLEDYVELLNNLHGYLKQQTNPSLGKLKQLESRIYCLKYLIMGRGTQFPEYLIIERKEYFESPVYFQYSFSEYPIFKDFYAYWIAALNTLGRPAYMAVFVLYENNIALPLNSVQNPRLPLKTSKEIIYPIGISNCLVFPEKLVEIPLFPFLYHKL